MSLVTLGCYIFSPRVIPTLHFHIFKTQNNKTVLFRKKYEKCLLNASALLKVNYLSFEEMNNGGTADEFHRFKFSHVQFSFKRQHVASKKVPPEQGTPAMQLFPLKIGTSAPGLNFINNKTWKVSLTIKTNQRGKENSFLCLWPLFSVVAWQAPLEEKSQRKKYKAFFTFPGSKYLTMNIVYITLPPPTQACSFGPCCLEWQITPK